MDSPEQGCFYDTPLLWYSHSESTLSVVYIDLIGQVSQDVNGRLSFKHAEMLFAMVVTRMDLPKTCCHLHSKYMVERKQLVACST